MATLSYQTARPTGLNVTLAAAAGGGDAIRPNDRGVVMFKNLDSTATVVTLVTPGTDKYGSARPDPTFSIPAAGVAVLGPFPTDLADPSTGLVTFTYSKVVTFTVGAFTV